MNSWLILSNRRENLSLLRDYVRQWADEHGLPAQRGRTLEKAAEEIFRYLVTSAYQPEQPGSISISLEKRGPRLRLSIEDDAPPHHPGRPGGLPAPAAATLFDDLQQLAESLVYYRTAERKNRMVIFLA
jgi:anti-sigma regulatory factor (Ser/Thr protein kinase)